MASGAGTTGVKGIQEAGIDRRYPAGFNPLDEP